MTDQPSYPKLVRTTDRVPSSSDPDTGNVHSAVRCARGKRPYEPPEMETFYPWRTGLPPDVIDEWSGEPAPPPKSTDEDPHDLDA